MPDKKHYNVIQEQNGDKLIEWHYPGARFGLAQNKDSPDSWYLVVKEAGNWGSQSGNLPEGWINWDAVQVEIAAKG